MPELHLRGGKIYLIYTIRDGEVVCWKDFSDLFLYPSALPLKDGGFILSGISERGLRDSSDVEYSAYRKITAGGDPFADVERTGTVQEFYCYRKYDSEGLEIDWESHGFTIETTYDGSEQTVYNADGVECDEEEWEKRLAPYRDMMEDGSFQLEWEYIFPKEEWDHLDAAEEGKGVSSTECGDEEWRCYERILSGDFSFIDHLGDRAHMTGKYRTSLDEETGRSRWKYILLDVNEDGIKDLFVRYDPGREDYTSADFSRGSQGGVACFSYQDGQIVWWETDLFEETYIPLRNGEMILWSGYPPSITMEIGRKSDRGRIVKNRGYEQMNIFYDDYHYDREWYETYGGIFTERADQEGVYYAVTDYDENGDIVSTREITQEEWREIEAMLERLLIPDKEWKPASVIMPVRCLEEFAVG